METRMLWNGAGRRPGLRNLLASITAQRGIKRAFWGS
jgi:hypothetical protein